MRYAWIKKHHTLFSVALMCSVLRVSRSGYYAWRKRKPSAQENKRRMIAAKAAVFHERSRKIYGYRKIHEDIIRETEIVCCAETVRRVMRKIGLFSRTKRKFVRTTDSKHRLPTAKNILARDFSASGMNEKWVADITYIQTREGWLYLAGVMDLYSRRIVGWAMSERIDAALVCDALEMALLHRCPGKGLLHHSDRGVQYASDRFQMLLDRYELVGSMSRKGNCWDNACKESFFGKLKCEWIQGRIYKTRREAEQDVFWYIEVFYNRMRRHASLGYVSPADFEAREAKEAVA